MDYPDYLQPVLKRINPEYGMNIRCDEGWWKLIALCDKELASIDPMYTVFQIKEKFGGLRYYYAPSNPSNRGKMDEIVRKYEKICAMTCEITGGHGFLMSDGNKLYGRVKTLNKSFIEEGWEQLHDDDIVPNRE